MRVRTMYSPSGHLFDGLDKAQIKKLERIAKSCTWKRGS